MLNQAMIDEFTENIDTSEMIIEYYKRRKTHNLERYFLQIEDWLNREVAPGENKPLVIDTDVGVEKKTLLVKWMSHHQETSKKKFPDFIVPHFAGTGGKSSNYFYAMYKILIGLREHFNISQKVELLENKILMYFNYWLDLCNRTINGRVVDDSIIILIFDGIDLFRDNATGEESSVALWLSQSFPSRVKVIVTAEADSEAMKHFKNNGCKVLTTETEPRTPRILLESYVEKPCFIIDENHKRRITDILKRKPDETLSSSFFLKIYLSTLLPCPYEGIIEENEIKKEEFKKVFKNFDYQRLERINTVDEFNNFLLDTFSMAIMDPQKFQTVLSALTLSEKGLSTQEILTLTKITEREWKHLIAILEPFLMKYKDLWKISEESFRKAITLRYLQNNPEEVAQLHSDIADVLSKTSNSLRKLEEETYHLYQCRSYFKLKEAVTNIENFLLLFNPRNKYELCRYWQTLELNGFDPASEYTKAIEGFELRYRPSPEKTFMIILQISRFFQEYSDFETRVIPDYRHPPIVGGVELKEIGLQREIKKLGMFISDEVEEIGTEKEGQEELKSQLAKAFPEYNDAMIKDLVEQMEQDAEKRRRELRRKELGITILGDDDELEIYDQGKKPEIKIQKDRGMRKFLNKGAKGNEVSTNRKDLPILSSIEAFNVDIPQHREKFVEFYVNQLLEKRNKNKPPIAYEQKQFDDEDDFVVENPEFPDMIQDTRDHIYGVPSLNLDIPKEVKKEVELFKEEQATFYYYKRWLWMMFPWVCLSYKSDYSRIIFECFSSPTKYISVADEKERTIEALRLAVESKIKKELVYAKPGDKTQFAILKNLKRNIPGFLPTSRKIIRVLPSREKESQNSEMIKTRSSREGLLDTIKRPLKFGELSPVNAKNLTDRVYPQSTSNKSIRRKGNHLFVTGDYATDGRPSISFSLSKDQTDHNTTMTKPVSLNNLDTQEYHNSSLSRTRTSSGTALNRTVIFSDQRIQNMLRNASEAISLMIQPKFMNAAFSISPKQFEMFESKVLQLKKDMNELINLRNASSEKLKHLSALEEGLDNRGALDCTEKFTAKMNKINEEIAKAEEVQNEATEQGRRLRMIIDVCNKNRTQNELWIHNLNYLVTNFKKVIAYEDASKDKIQRETFILQQQANKIIEDYGKRIAEHQKSMQHLKKESKRRQDIMEQMTETQLRLQEMLLDTPVESVHESEHEQEPTLNLTKEQIERIREKEKYDLEHLDEMREQVERIQETIGLDFETPKFNDFVNGLEKMSKYEQELYEKENDIKKLKEEMNAHVKLHEVYKKARLAERKAKTVIQPEYSQIKDEKKLQALLRERKRENETLSRSITKNTNMIIDVKNTLVKICKNIGLKVDDANLHFTEVPVEEIVTRLQDKVEMIQALLPSEEFERFSKGKIDFQQYSRETPNSFDVKTIDSLDNLEYKGEMKIYRGKAIYNHLEQEMP